LSPILCLVIIIETSLKFTAVLVRVVVQLLLS